LGRDLLQRYAEFAVHLNKVAFRFSYRLLKPLKEFFVIAIPFGNRNKLPRERRRSV